MFIWTKCMLVRTVLMIDKIFLMTRTGFVILCLFSLCSYAPIFVQNC